MKQFTYTIKDALGIHARPAGLLAKKAKSYADTAVTITANGKTVNLGQLMKLMALGVKQGTEVTITCDGANEEEAAAGLLAFLEENL
ncbi:MAG: HPr family phosphocarrier protein [Clostridia bacterium]|jgi:phosphocarrier protein|nr:HPr family phosphocarrier protein [Clostridia bacterium]MBQ6120384.1 HPr family phosphocarrier protein [Clostridia bacterium]MBQ6326716.1 HPr family phosphocarrier protein [Clostridia bacterium]MBQ9038862.1 HPr family phosphocarrier protein [Clostridia bacterium]